MFIFEKLTVHTSEDK